MYKKTPRRYTIMFSKTFISIILFTTIFGKAVWGNEIYHIPPSPPTIGNSVSFETIISIDQAVDAATFLYRMYGQQSYKEIEMDESLGGSWRATISKVPEGNSIEYFFMFNMQNGSSMFSPTQEPNQNPYILSVIPLPSLDINNKNSNEISSYQKENSFLIISPDENDIVYSDAVLFIVSLYNIPEINFNSIHLYVDGQDVTTDVLITTDIMTYAPEQVKPGIKMFTITASTNQGTTITPFHHTISVISAKLSNTKMNNFSYSVNGKSEVAMDQVAMEQDNYEKLNIYQTDLTFKARWPRLQFKSRLKITSEESPLKQPKNRYSATVKSGNSLKISVGDFTPSLSPYTINGKRLRGIGTEWRLGWLKFQSAHGLLDREIQGLDNIDHSYEISNVILDSNKVIYELDRRGYTFRNDMSSYRLALNIDEKIILGSTFMKTKSDIESVKKELPDAIFTVSNNNELDPEVPQLISGEYTFSEFQNLLSEDVSFGYNLSDKGWGGHKPQQNLVLGTDFRLFLDEYKFLLEGYWAISFLNKDIWDGTMTLAELDTLMEDSLDANGLKYMDGLIFGMMDTISIPDPTDFENLMILNTNLVPIIPIDINLFESNPLKAIMNMPSTAYNLKFRSLYFNNIFELQYLQVGPEFTSLANPYFSKNTREVSIIDKIWLFERSLQSSVNFKIKTNDILETNTNPFIERTYGINLNYIPSMALPSAMYGHHSIIRTNTKTAIDSLIAGEDTTLHDLRVDFITANNLFTLHIPINRKDVSYSIGGTYNSIIGTDRLAKERPDTLFISQSSSMQLISLVFGAHYKRGLKLTLNFSNFTNNLNAQGKTELNGSSITGSYPIFRDKISLTGTLSHLSSSGLSELKNYGLSLGSTIKISNAFRMNLAASTKFRSTSSGTNIANSAVKLSTNYIF